ncbi:hypothetical protein M0R45_026969 [Rubus argutus]|uniref:Uncharacterized protein n=1 Tax=Rubus argutus TaxID=59490 RepID=A0AAW1X0G8_RUBAR
MASISRHLHRSPQAHKPPHLTSVSPAVLDRRRPNLPPASPASKPISPSSVLTASKPPHLARDIVDIDRIEPRNPDAVDFTKTAAESPSSHHHRRRQRARVVAAVDLAHASPPPSRTCCSKSRKREARVRKERKEGTEE